MMSFRERLGYAAGSPDGIFSPTEGLDGRHFTHGGARVPRGPVGRELLFPGTLGGSSGAGPSQDAHDESMEALREAERTLREQQTLCETLAAGETDAGIASLLLTRGRELAATRLEVRGARRSARLAAAHPAPHTHAAVTSLA
jgi:hypothetical protein